MRTLLVSPDLTADDILSAGSIVATPLHGEVAPFRLISALTRYPPLADVRASSTGGHRLFVPFPRKVNRGLSFYANTPNASTFSQIVV